MVAYVAEGLVELTLKLTDQDPSRGVANVHLAGSIDVQHTVLYYVQYFK